MNILNGFVKKGLYDGNISGWHSYIVCYYDGVLSIHENEPSLIIISEYIEGEDLDKWIEENISNDPPDIETLWLMVYLNLINGISSSLYTCKGICT